MEKNSKIYVSGHRGMVGAATCRALKATGFDNLVTRNRNELDLLNQSAVNAFFANEHPDVVVIAAARVGGIYANNTYPADFLYENATIAQNTIHSAYISGVKRLLFLGSTCIYPKKVEQPIREDSLLTSPLELTNEAYAIAKITGLKMCQYYRRQFGVCYHSAMPTNLYGPGDNYHPQNSHVLPALIRRFHEAKESGVKEVSLWGTGTPLREFLHVDDAASGIVHLLQLDDPPDWVNIGSGTDISIGNLAKIIMSVIGYNGRITFDTDKPDGTPRKLSDISLIRSTGWAPCIPIEEGVAITYNSFLKERMCGSLRE